MHTKVRQTAQQRFDLLDFLTQECNVENEFAIMLNQLFTQGKEGGYILKGMQLNVDGGAPLINATLEEIAVVSTNGIMHRRLASEAQLTAGTTEGMVATGTNFIEAEIFTVSDGSDSRVFWDPLVNAEFVQATDTITRQDIRLISNAVGFTTGAAADKLVRVGIVITNAGVVERIHDSYGNTVFSGAPADPAFEENKLFRLNDTDSDGDTNRFSFGAPRTDLQINSLKNTIDALYTQLKDLIGDGKAFGSNTNDWFEELPIQLYALAADRATKMDGASGRSWVLGTNTLTWTTDIAIRQPGSGGSSGDAIVTAGNTTLLNANGLALYVDLDRDATSDYNPTLQVVDFANWFDSHTQDRFLIAHRADDKIYWQDGVVTEETNAVALLSISNVDDIDGNNPAKTYFHVFGSAPDQVLLYLYGQRFHQAFYTEVGRHNHSLSGIVTGNPSINLDSHIHTSGGYTAASDGSSTHNHRILTDTPGEADGDTIIDTRNLGSGYAYDDRNTNNEKWVEDTTIPNHTHDVAGSSGPVNGTITHTHSLSGNTNSRGVIPGVGAVRDAVAAKQWFDDLQIFIDGVDRTTDLLLQAGLVKFGDGTSGHAIVTAGVELDITAYVAGLGEHNIEYTLSGTDNGGRLRSVLYTLEIP